MREFFNVSRTGAVRVWRIQVERDAVITEYGQLDGKMQTVTDYGKPKNIGRANELSAEEDALNLADRMILAKTRAGYVEDLETLEVPEIDFGNLPGNLCFYKPQNTLGARLRKAANEGRAFFTRKRDGEMMVLCTDSKKNISIYSRKMLRHHHLEPERPWTHRFPHLIEALKERIPRDTILLGEMVVGTNDDNRWALAGIMKSKTDEALARQMDGTLARFYVWDIAFLRGNDLITGESYRDRLEVLEKNVKRWQPLGCEYLLPVEAYSGDGIRDWADDEGLDPELSLCESATALAQTEGWEGWVVVAEDAVYGDKAYNFRGKPDRPATCGKLKPVFEDDFIAMWDPDLGIGHYGNGRNTGKLGSVELHQHNTRGELIYICDMGNGWSQRFIEENSDPLAWPKVVQVKYDSRCYKMRGDKTNALQFPRFVCERTDKDLDECINPEL